MHDEEETENHPEAPRIAKIHHKPTQAEIDEHEVTHYPWRAWCSCCVRGAAVNDPHHRIKDRIRTKPAISVDYSFLSSSGQAEETQTKSVSALNST